MRKTSQDGGDSTSITSGVENEIKKSILKPKKTSLKRKAPNFSHDSDDAVVEPLLQKDKDKAETSFSAKFFTKDKKFDKTNLLDENKVKTSTTGFCGTTESLLSMKECEEAKTVCSVTAPIYNYMNTNVFNSHDNMKTNVTAKSQIFVEIDGTKQSDYHPNPLIFTTAKIHADGKSKNIDLVQVIPVPILSTIEVNVSKGGDITTNEKKLSDDTSLVNIAHSTLPNDNYKKYVHSVTTTAVAPSTTINKDSIPKSASPSDIRAFNAISVLTALENKLPTTAQSISSNTIDKTSFNQKETIMPTVTENQTKVLDYDCFKNNVTVKTITPFSGHANAIEGSSQQHQSTTNYTVANNLLSDNLSNRLANQQNSHSLIDKNKNSHQISGSGIKSAANGGLSANKQLQRQKTITEDISNLEIKPTLSIDTSTKNGAVVTSTFSHHNETDSNKNKDSDKLSKPSANLQIIVTKTLTNTATTNYTSFVPLLKPDVTDSVTSITNKNSVSTSLNTFKSCSPSTTETFPSKLNTLATTSKPLTDSMESSTVSLPDKGIKTASPNKTQTITAPKKSDFITSSVTTTVQIVSECKPSTTMSKTPPKQTTLAVSSSINKKETVTQDKINVTNITPVTKIPVKSDSTHSGHASSGQKKANQSSMLAEDSSATRKPLLASSTKTSTNTLPAALVSTKTSIQPSLGKYDTKSTTSHDALKSKPLMPIQSTFVSKAPTMGPEKTTTNTPLLTLAAKTTSANPVKKTSSINKSSIVSTQVTTSSISKPAANSSSKDVLAKIPAVKIIPKPSISSTSSTSVTMPMMSSANTSSSKPFGMANTVPTYTSSKRQSPKISETVKNGGSNSKDNKDGKVSKT